MTDSINVDSNLSHSETTAPGIKKELLYWCQYDKLQPLFFPKEEFLAFQLAQNTLPPFSTLNIRAVFPDILFGVSANETVYFGGWLIIIES